MQQRAEEPHHRGRHTGGKVLSEGAPAWGSGWGEAPPEHQGVRSQEVPKAEGRRNCASGGTHRSHGHQDPGKAAASREPEPDLAAGMAGRPVEGGRCGSWQGQTRGAELRAVLPAVSPPADRLFSPGPGPTQQLPDTSGRTTNTREHSPARRETC